jgi:hypothetical protein
MPYQQIPPPMPAGMIAVWVQKVQVQEPVYLAATHHEI